MQSNVFININQIEQYYEIFNANKKEGKRIHPETTPPTWVAINADSYPFTFVHFLTDDELKTALKNTISTPILGELYSSP